MDDAKSVVGYTSQKAPLMCGADKCTNQYTVIDEHTIRVKVPEQNAVTANGKRISNEAFEITMLDMDGEFQANGIKLYYYHEFWFKNISTQFAYSNEEKPIMLETDFQWTNGNEFDMFRKNANFTCRFSGQQDPPI